MPVASERYLLRSRKNTRGQHARARTRDDLQQLLTESIIDHHTVWFDRMTSRNYTTNKKLAAYCFDTSMCHTINIVSYALGKKKAQRTDRWQYRTYIWTYDINGMPWGYDDNYNDSFLNTCDCDVNLNNHDMIWKDSVSNLCWPGIKFPRS